MLERVSCPVCNGTGSEDMRFQCRRCGGRGYGACGGCGPTGMMVDLRAVEVIRRLDHRGAASMDPPVPMELLSHSTRDEVFHLGDVWIDEPAFDGSLASWRASPEAAFLGAARALIGEVQVMPPSKVVR